MSNNKENVELPSSVNNVQLGEGKGLLSPIGDPLGKVLNKGLSPVGNIVGGLAEPVTSLTGGGKEKSAEPESIGGKQQSGQNPLGL
ncbi:hypothetical protein MBLNU459_g4769t1 [Dothideomycetes sp. NU459]